MTAAEAATQTLADWLSDRLDEDEAVAQAALTVGRPWLAHVTNHDARVLAGRGDDEWLVAECDYGPHAIHAAVFDPARVLAEVASKRTIVKSYLLFKSLGGEYDDKPIPGLVGSLGALEEVVHQLAQVYADHEDFRPEWRRS